MDPVRAPAIPAGFAEPAAEAFDSDPLRRRETVELVSAYYRIDDPGLRRRFFGLARALAGGPERGAGEESFCPCPRGEGGIEVEARLARLHQRPATIVLSLTLAGRAACAEPRLRVHQRIGVGGTSRQDL